MHIDPDAGATNPNQGSASGSVAASDPVPATNAGTTRRILVFNASPRAAGHTANLLAPAVEAIAAAPGFSVDQISLSGRQVLSCQDCRERCAAEGRCWIEDDFAELSAHWHAADGILLGTPVFTYGPPSKLYAFFQRLRAVQDLAARALPVPVGIVVQGGAEYSGAEITAQALLSLCLAAGCTPISGDMPGSGQGVIGQIADNAPSIEHLIHATRRLAMRVCEVVKILEAGRESGAVRLLIVRNGRVDDAQEALLQGAHSVPTIGVEAEEFDFCGAAVAPCQACTEHCSTNGECVYQDDMQAFCSRWLHADAIAWLAGASSVGAAPAIRAAIDRMNELRFETFFGQRQSDHMPRYLKATAIAGCSGDPEATAANVQFLRHAALLYQNVILPGQAWHEPVTGALGRRLVVLGSILKTGLLATAGELPDEYYPSRARLGSSARSGVSGQ